MLRRTLEIITSSFKMALQELWKNKLRTFLSLFGITIGIFCIIGVLATVNSLERNIKNEVSSFGTNTIYVDKWEYVGGGGNEYPWWKYVNRPLPKYEEIKQIKERTPSARFVSFRIYASDEVDYRGSSLSNVNYYGVSEDFDDIQPIPAAYGRYMSDAEFDRGVNVIAIGNDIAEKLFGSPELAVDKEVTIRGRKARVIGVIKKQGKQMIGGWDFDQSIVIPYKFARNIINELRADPLIMVQGQDYLTSKALKDDLSGAMRGIRKLSPTQEDNFALNDINDLTESVSRAFASLNIGGWAIAALSLIVGMFGVANIMFVTVRERTGQIGLKKAIGAKKSSILFEFLLEAAILCLMGGAFGLFFVYILSVVLSGMDFPMYISFPLLISTFIICLVVGILAGIFPASRAAKMDPVVAIRSK